MTFSDKLNGLFRITQTKGKELADTMHITPPQITKMRKGLRGMPRNLDSSRAIALFFAVRCNTKERLSELSELMKISSVCEINSENALADIILDWLNDEREPDDYVLKKSSEFFRRFGTLADGGINNSVQQPVRGLYSETGTLAAYYGSEGRRKAVLNFFDYIYRRRQAYTVNMLTDESISWITELPEYSGQLQASMLKLVEQGCTFKRITGQVTDINEAFDALNRWLPLYISGKATSYCYKRMRDNLNRVTIFVVPGVVVLFSFSVNNTSLDRCVTFLTADEKTVNTLALDFERYLSECEPVMNVYSSALSLPEINDCMYNFEAVQTDSMYYSRRLSFITLPWDIANSLKADDLNKKNAFLVSFAQRYKKFRENLKNYQFVDIIRLSDIEEILNGKVPIPASYLLSEQVQYYTPSGYLKHLYGILYLLNNHKNYHVAVKTSEFHNNTAIYVKEGNTAIFTRDGTPFNLYETKQPHIVSAFGEYLLRSLPENALTEQYRREAVAKITALCTKIEKAVGKAKNSN